MKPGPSLIATAGAAVGAGVEQAEDIYHGCSQEWRSALIIGICIGVFVASLALTAVVIWWRGGGGGPAAPTGQA